MTDAAAVVAPQTIIIAAPPATFVERVEYAVATAKSYVRAVTCQEMREALSVDLQLNKALQKEIEDERTKITKPINEGLRNTNTLFKRMSTPLEDAEAEMKAEASRWDRSQERIRIAAAAEAARVADVERKRLESEAAKQRDAGNAETAHAIAEAARFVAPIPVPAAPKIAGESTREHWHAEIVDIIALARAVGAGEVSPECIEPNMPVLNAQARSLKKTMSIPGVIAKSDDIIAATAKR